jgi:DNA-binding CsgD family transcriptional regulator
MKTRFDWTSIRSSLQGALSDDDARLLDLLVAGKSTPQIAVILGVHRSRIWRRSQVLKQRLSATESQVQQETE